MAEIDENGFIYIYGRVSDHIVCSSGEKIYLFDIANKIKESPYIDDAIVLRSCEKNNKTYLVAHITWADTPSDAVKAERIEGLNQILSSYLPHDVVLVGYREYESMLPYSPTTLKKDKNKMALCAEGIVQINNGTLQYVEI